MPHITLVGSTESQILRYVTAQTLFKVKDDVRCVRLDTKQIFVHADYQETENRIQTNAKVYGTCAI